MSSSSSILATENSKAIVIPVILRGGNYLLWARTTKTALCGRGLWSHVLEDKTPEEDEDTKGETKSEEAKAEEAKWFQEDQTVLGLIQNSLEPAILEAYSYCETAKSLWETLKNVFGNDTNLSRVFEVKKAINDLSQEDMDFKTHFGKFRSLWAELEMLRPSTLDPKILNERREQDKVFGLLLTLNPVFNDLIKHILRDDKLPSLEDVCARIQKEQGSIGLFKKGELISANKGVFKPEERKTWVCDHCKKKGHSKEKCWILHPHFKPNKFKDARANLAHEPAAGSNSGGEVAMSASEEYVRKSDLEALIKAFASKQSGITFYSHKPSSGLVVDSGASHHMINNSKLLNSIELALGKVIIANGDGIPIEGIGKLNLFNKTSEAFYVPKFTSNLVSVKRATKDLNCYAIFGPNDVHFQDIESGKLLGKGGTRDDLYVLEDVSPNKPDADVSFKSCEQRSKLDAKSIKCMFLGYSTTQKGYKCYDPINNRTYVSREVKFLEEQGYYVKKDWESLKDLSSSPSDLATSLRFLLDHLGNQAPPRQTPVQATAT
ncbi:uncharacterized protein LOC112085026, partial [Eutrema salsugineum]|uniref:uncharacterized protein LOC112085026 n=1 Tax=Eutrema salsugineum TaxID=72664 RepID=UPI000CED5C3D